MTENTNDFLGLKPESEDTAPAKSNSPTPQTGNNTGPENIIIALAYIILFIGILGCFIYGISLCDSRYTRSLGVTVMILGPIYSIIAWAVLMIMARLSINVREIKEILSQKTKSGE